MEQRAFCPICEDPEESRSPSAMFNLKRGIWNCMKGEHGGSTRSLIADLKKNKPGFAERTASRPRKAPAEGKRSGDPIDPKLVRAWHHSLLSNNKVLADFIRQRGIQQAAIEEFEIGWDAEARRYTFPVYDEEGNLANVRKYRMNSAAEDMKFLNMPGHGESRLYNVAALEDAYEVYIWEGEPDTVHMSQYGLASVCGTSGAKTWMPRWGPLFAEKIVYVCYDADDAGNAGALKVINNVSQFAVAVHKVEFPEGDATDYMVKGKHTLEDFLRLRDKAVVGTEPGKPRNDMAPSKGKRISLLESMSDSNSGSSLELVVSVVGKQQEPFTAPRDVTAICDMSKGAVCEVCPMLARHGKQELTVHPHDARVLQFVDIDSNKQRRVLKGMFGARCDDRIEYEVDKLWRIEELSVQNSVDERIDDATEMPIRRTIMSVGSYATQTNAKMSFIGTNVQDPKTGVLRYHAWRNNNVDLDIDKFLLTKEIREKLEAFRPDAGQDPLDKCIAIAEDMSYNVTQIFGRTMLHVGMDLVWHSPVAFRVRGHSIDKGWLEMMVVGDTRTGKSEIGTRLIKHYRAGKMVSCEGVTFAGLIGGVQQIGNSWHMTWGAIPMQDRRLVVLDEVSGMSDKNIIEQMSSVRSAGIAQITKIAAESTSARTRLIWITNPADGRFLADNRKGGIGALQTVVPNQEDIARFDFVMAAARGDVSSIDINTEHEPGPPEHDSEACELLVKWSWSLGRDDVHIADAAAELASQEAIRLGDKYTPSPPLIQAENVRFKILRIAAAIAARTFSARADGGLTVTAVHVRGAVRFLEIIYADPALGYEKLSVDETKRVRTSADKVGLAREMFLAQSTVLQTLQMNPDGEFRIRDFEEFAGLEKAQAGAVATALHRWGLVRYGAKGIFVMTEQLIELLESMANDPDA